MDIHRYATVKPAALQIEHHPYLQQPALVEFCHKQGRSCGNQAKC